MEVSRLNRNWVRVISRGSVVFVVVWCWNQGDISLRVCLISTEDGAIDWFLSICLIYGKDIWVPMERL